MPSPTLPPEDPFARRGSSPNPGGYPHADPFRRDPWAAPSDQPPPPAGRDTKDPGSPGSRRWAWLAFVVLFSITVFMQQCAKPAATPPPADAVADAPNDMLSLTARVLVKVGAGLKDLAGPNASGHSIGGQLLQSLDESAAQAGNRPVDRLRIAIAAAELINPDEATQRLESVETQLIGLKQLSPTPDPSPDPSPTPDTLASNDELLHDLRLLRAIYSGGRDALTPDERDRLVTRHGKLGQLALTHGLPESDPDRQREIGGGVRLTLTFAAFGGVILLLIPASLICCVIALVRLSRPPSPAPTSRRSSRFLPPIPGGSVYLETVAVFIFAFFLVQLLAQLVGMLMGPSADQRTLTLISISAQWFTLLALLWPILRGVSWGEHARRMGWTRGRGVLREVGAGIFGYLAGFPLVILAFVTMIAILLARSAIQSASGTPPEPPANPVLELISLGGIIPIMLFALATIWAPLAEESVFRGALFRHLRSRTGVVLASIASALVFGFMHGYEAFMLLPVITLGFNFAIMREWRTSLIAPIVAHALHNGTILGFALFVASQIT